MAEISKALSPIILESLELDLCRRSPSAALGFIGAMVFVLLYPVATSPDFFTFQQVFAYLAIISCAARFYSARKINRGSKETFYKWRKTHFFFIILNALFFGLVFTVGLADPQSSLHAKFTIFFIMGSIISASTTTLSLTPLVQITFFSLVGVLPIAVLLFLYPSDPAMRMWIILIIVFGFYNIQSSKQFFWTSANRYQFEHSLIIEKQNLTAAIEKLKLSQEEVLHQKSIAEYSSKLASLGEMAGGIAHEINNPLNIILLLIEKQVDLLGETPLNLEGLKKDNRRMESTINRITKIVSGLRNFARSGQNDPLVNSALQTIFADTLSLCHERFKLHEIDFKIADFSLELTVRTRPVQLSQVLLNLLNNAFDAIEGFEKKWIALTVTELETTVQIRVIDCGNGLSQATQDRIFIPFFTTKEVGKGTGLGLSISKGLIESHHGKMYYEKTAAHTTFVVELEKSLKTV